MYSAPNLAFVNNTSGALMSSTNDQITQLLHNWSDGKPEALDDLIPLVFDDLRRMASRYLRHERFLTLQPTALVNEVFLKLLQRDSLSWKNRLQFYGFVATEMRRILVDRARRRNADRRGGGQQPLTIDVALEVAAERNIDLQALDEALAGLASLDPDLSQVVELRFFVGLSHSEIADLQETSVATVRRRWESARTWLYRELGPGDSASSRQQPESTRGMHRAGTIRSLHRGKSSSRENPTT